MQGRITKVLNMKPAEILSMIEEAAGTRMYESKKQTAQKTIEKKDAKLNEINKILNEEITPTLTRLKGERQAYMDYTKVLRELEHLTKVYRAWQYTQLQEKCKNSADQLKALQKNIEDCQNLIDSHENEKKNLHVQIMEMEKRKDEELGGMLGKLEELHKEAQMTETKINVDIKHLKDNLKEEDKRKRELEKHMNDDNSVMAAKVKELEDLMTQCHDIIEKGKHDAEALVAAQQHFKAVSSGLSSNTDGEEATLAEQLMAAKKDIAGNETEIKQAEMKLKHATAAMKKMQDVLKKTEGTCDNDETHLTALVEKLEKLKDQLERINYAEGREEELIDERQRLQRQIQSDQASIDSLEARFPNLSFSYQDPEPGFNRKDVHGLVCKLIQVHNPETARALEVTAGNRLYNVVVQNEIVGKKLLDKGRLKRRITIIPLNKIADHSLRADVIRRAEQLVGKENVQPALSLIGYSGEVEAAMKFVFGGTFISPDMDSAKTLAFNRDVNKRTVTLDGDVFEPAGTLTGGATQRDESILNHLSRIHDVQNTLNGKRERLNYLDQELSVIKKAKEQYLILRQKVDPIEEEVAIIRARIQNSSRNQQLEELRVLEATVQEQQNQIKGATDDKKKRQEKADELELKLKDSAKYRARELKAAQDNLAKCKKASDESSKLAKLKEQGTNSLKLEIAELESGLKTYVEQNEEVNKVIQNIKATLENLEIKQKEVNIELERTANDVKIQKEELRAQNNEISQLKKQYSKYDKECNNNKLKIQQLDHDIKKMKDDSKESKDQILNLERTYKWIPDEKEFFGVPNTEYDFQATDINEAGQRISKLQETKEKLSKSVNMRAQNMMIETEEQYQSLLSRKQIVENDKAKISRAIQELDIKKKIALEEAWEKVNKDFGSIYSLLLPGTQAKLVPPDGMSCTDGLEIKVAFGEVWKESLNELSGGQRSLVALSLILSLLLFKPAPIYILDEVDAALDLSHTQNIGQMLRTHFQHSQFIIVSLKDGMFNNANVLFKTKFVDGVSTVSRHSQKSK